MLTLHGWPHLHDLVAPSGALHHHATAPVHGCGGIGFETFSGTVLTVSMDNADDWFKFTHTDRLYCSRRKTPGDLVYPMSNDRVE